VDDHHFKDDVGGVDPLLHDAFQQVFSGEDTFFLFEEDVDSDEHFIDLFVFSVHDGVGQSDDWFHDESAEGSFNRFAFFVNSLFLPLLGLRVEIIVSPESFHHFWYVGVELLGVDLCELGDCECVTLLSGSESNVSDSWI